MRARVVVLAMSALTMAACATGPETGTPGPSPLPTAPLASPQPTQATASPRPSSTATVARPSPTPSTLHAGGFARIVVDAVRVRTGPSSSAPQLVLMFDAGDGGIHAEEISIGTHNNLTAVFVIDGPVAADGLTWWRVSPTVSIDGERESIPSRIAGWIAQGDGDRDWVVPDDPCPTRPVEVASLIHTAANWAIGLGCFGGELLSLRGWYAGQPDGWSDPSCDLEPAFLCHRASIFPVERGWGPGNENRLDFHLDPGIDAMPTARQWIQVTGMFDAPIARTCPPDDEIGDLACRYFFVASEVRIAN